jgi:hypothetical protein
MHDPIEDDHRLEAYLKSFRPLPPAPLPKVARPWKVFAFSAAAAAAVAAVLLVLPHFRHVSAPVGDPEIPVTLEMQPITLGNANALLVNASSWKKAIDDAGFAFRPSLKRTGPGRQSALEFLSQEDLSQ